MNWVFLNLLNQHNCIVHSRKGMHSQSVANSLAHENLRGYYHKSQTSGNEGNEVTHYYNSKGVMVGIVYEEKTS